MMQGILDVFVSRLVLHAIYRSNKANPLLRIICYLHPTKSSMLQKMLLSKSSPTDLTSKVITQLSQITAKDCARIITPIIRETFFPMKRSPFRLVFINITNNCNLSCVYCVNKEEGTFIQKSIERQIFTGRIDKLRRYVNVFAITGGEPLLNIDVLLSCSQFPDCLFIVFTNGLLISDEILNKLDHIRNLVFIISVDGPAHRNDLSRGLGAFSKAMSSLIRIREHGYLCGISTVIDNPSDNFAEYDDYIETLIQNKSSFALFLLNSHVTDTALIHDYKRFSEFLLESLHPLPMMSFPFVESMMDKHNCVGGSRLFYVQLNGDVTICPMRKKVCGNIDSENLRSIVRRLSSISDLCSFWKNGV